ncbi:class I SAM-dependent methyltransferase [Streptomyces sp. NPDC051172]|uniref:class I SAM-dependent methyltransferase n=1 Tax=Streptomyces sp. NPDC051172 TaxID=3155796 RepID=UPI00342F533F
MTETSRQYDNLADRYAASDSLLIRAWAEYPVFRRELGDLIGRNVLDLACGTGFYTNIAAQLGANRVVGVDASLEMIDAARELATHDNIEFLVHDITTMPILGEFDVVIAAFLLNYAPTRTALDAMCARIAAHLRPGGRLVADIPRSGYDRQRPMSAKYGYTYEWPSDLSDGDTFTFTLHLASPLTIRCTWWSDTTYQNALTSAGLTDVHFHPWKPTEEGMSNHDTGFWDEWNANPLAQVITATKPPVGDA